AGVGPRVPPDVRLLPWLRLRPLRLPALQLRVARRRRRAHLEAQAGLLRRRRDARRACGAGDLQPRDGDAVGRALAPVGAPLREADQARRPDDAAPPPL